MVRVDEVSRGLFYVEVGILNQYHRSKVAFIRSYFENCLIGQLLSGVSSCKRKGLFLHRCARAVSAQKQQFLRHLPSSSEVCIGVGSAYRTYTFTGTQPSITSYIPPYLPRPQHPNVNFPSPLSLLLAFDIVTTYPSKHHHQFLKKALPTSHTSSTNSFPSPNATAFP